MTVSETKAMTVGIIGLGYVGLPLWLEYSENGATVLGFDIDSSKTDVLNAGQSYIKHIGDEAVATARATGRAEATTNFQRISEVDAVIICVPTPLDKHFEPDLSYVRETLDAVLPFLKDGQVLSLESTTYPGTTDEEVVARVEARGFVVGETMHVVYSPEREDPGNPNFSGGRIPKVVGGKTAACLKKGVELYEIAFDKVVPVSSPQVAEFSKLLENIYRAVNIGLVNEMKVVADAMDVDIWEVIDAAATKPFGFTPFYPGPGLGGHCIPIDPFYLTWKAKEYGLHTRFIELAGEINRAMPQFVIDKVVEALNGEKKAVNGSRILLVGLSYKPNVDDMRESPTFALMDLLKARGAEVSYYDPHIPEIGPTREHAEWQGLKSIDWNQEGVQSYDAVVISTMHDAVNCDQLAQWSKLIIDTRNSVDSDQTAVIKA